MRLTLLLVFIILFKLTQSQISPLQKKLKAEREIINCETVAFNAADLIYEQWSIANFDSCDLITNEWIALCGSGEFIRRMVIIEHILQNKEVTDSIQSYISKEFYLKFRWRSMDSKRADFGNYYTKNEGYFDFVPLRHPLDSLLFKSASDILRSDTLSDDERLICTLFSGDTERFESAVLKKEYKNSHIGSYARKKLSNDRQRWLMFNIYTGVFHPIGKEQIFSFSPTIGLSVTSPMMYKLIGELGFKIRINLNDNEFKYYALGDTNLVNSGTSIFLGGFLGYTLFSNDKITIIPKIGIGLEDVDTGLSRDKDNSDQTEYFNLKTIHLSGGITAMVPVRIANFIGLGLSYHYCPYQWDKNLYTKISNHQISAELFYRF